MLVALLAGAIATTGAIAPVLAAAPVPRVALIVGPVGSLTSTYKALANAAAQEAQAAGAEVVKVYSPNATWSAVRKAVTGASIVVYLGHGNGWPSPYRNSLYPPTQNGFGLNPVAGVDDSAHQYFGEKSVATLKLADNAVVVLSHLCYASGNSEPGLAEGTRDMAIARVDNFAAGFIRAGAQAVAAEAHMGPAYYVRQLLRTQLSIERIWQASPSAHGNTFALASQRSAGYTEQLDPDHTSGGYYRSLVSKGVTASQVRSGATGTIPGVISEQPSEPSLAAQGLRFGSLSLDGLPVAGDSTTLTLPVAAQSAKLIPSGARIGVRWDPILLDPSAAPDVVPLPVTDDSGMSVPDLAAPGASPSPGSGGTDQLEVDLVAPEQLGNVVEVSQVKRSNKALQLTVTYPSAPGLYRLVPSLHTPTGVAYDAATQALLTPVLVRIGGPIAVAYGAPASIAVTAGAQASIAVRVVNAGSKAWDAVATAPPSGNADAMLSWLRTSRAPATLVATWVSAALDHPVPGPVSTVLDSAISAPGGDGMVNVPLVGPAMPGDYLLLLDVVSPAEGTLSALGSAPALIRVSVSSIGVAPAPSAVPGVVTPGTTSTGTTSTAPGTSSTIVASPAPTPAVSLPGVVGPAPTVPVATLPGETPAPTSDPRS